MSKAPDINTMLAWIYEAQTASKEWRAESWRDSEMYDGHQWSATELAAAEDISVDPITVNKIFPTIELVKGTQSLNQLSIVAKGRTQEDSETGNIMSESIQYVLDQNGGQGMISNAFGTSIVPGIDYLQVGVNPDPRKERLQVKGRDWKTCWVDPFGDPWLDPTLTRYMFFARWLDMETLKAAFPEKAKEIGEQFSDLSGDNRDSASFMMDEATDIEMARQGLSSGAWVQTERKRCRPVELWFPCWEQSIFALFPDGRVVELDDKANPQEQYQIIQEAQQVVKATVQKMWTATIFGRLMLVQRKSELNHDNFPVVPFISYLDRFNLPYGVPRQIRGQNIEVNKRRSMALAMLYKRRLTIESDIVDTPEELDSVFVEANKLDGVVKIKPNMMNSIKAEDHMDKIGAQINLMQMSENEIQQISGANDESMGYGSNAVSGKAIEKRVERGATITAPLFGNLRRSLKMLGELVVAGVQNEWTHEKVLRITDNLSGAEKFIVLNERTPEGTIKNNICQGRYDLVVSDAPQTDTVREKNMEMMIAWIQKSPPEIIPHLIQMAMELSDIPNKDKLLERLKPILGIDPGTEDMTADEIKQHALEQMEAHAAEQAEQAKVAKQLQEFEMEQQALENQKLAVSIEAEKLEVDKGRAELEAVQMQSGFAMTRQHFAKMEAQA